MVVLVDVDVLGDWANVVSRVEVVIVVDGVVGVLVGFIEGFFFKFYVVVVGGFFVVEFYFV